MCNCHAGTVNAFVVALTSIVQSKSYYNPYPFGSLVKLACLPFLKRENCNYLSQAYGCSVADKYNV